MQITGKTRLLALLGWPVAHSRSPAMHNAAAAALNLDLIYLPLPVHPDHLPTALQALIAFNFLGANVTVPHKQTVIPHLTTLSPPAQAIGAVNTITINPIPNPQSPIPNLQSPSLPVSSLPVSQSPISHSPISHSPNLHGHNTDHYGFAADLQQHAIPTAGRRCLVLGAGGSARAVVYALARSGGHVTVYARRPQQAHDLVAALQPHLPDAALQAAPWDALAHAHTIQAPLIVNTTPVGMHPHPDDSPWPAETPFPANADVYDLIYNPLETRLMQQARAAGCRAANGLGMLLQQGALAFELWTGHKPPLETMAAALQS